jgi:hypothetical protein
MSYWSERFQKCPLGEPIEQLKWLALTTFQKDGSGAMFFLDGEQAPNFENFTVSDIDAAARCLWPLGVHIHLNFSSMMAPCLQVSGGHCPSRK